MATPFRLVTNFRLFPIKKVCFKNICLDKNTFGAIITFEQIFLANTGYVEIYTG